MPPLSTTIGQLAVNSALPEELRDHDRVLDKKGLKVLLQQVATQHPDRYDEVTRRLVDVGRHSAFASGGYSIGLRDLLTPVPYLKARAALERRIETTLDRDDLDPKRKEEEVIKATSQAHEGLDRVLLDHAVAQRNPLGLMVLSGSRGSAGNLKTLVGADGLYQDHRDAVIPFPILNSYSRGLTPAEYYAASFGARKGLVDTKLSVAQGGFLAKNLTQAAHRLVVSGLDADEDDGDYAARMEHHRRGLPAATDDPDNEGALLAYPAGPYKRNTLLSAKVLKDLVARKVKRIVVRSPIAGGAKDGGLYARDVGVREHGALPSRGEFVGAEAAQAASEPLTQGSLGSKHTGGIAGAAKSVGGLKLINLLTQVPKDSLQWATHARVDGRVSKVEPAPAGGQFVTAGDERHYVPAGRDLRVKVGDRVEAGDQLSEGVTNPAAAAEHQGIGEGRRRLVDTFRKALKESGVDAHRRNLELLARGLINHVEITHETPKHAPGDVVPYDLLERDWMPRPGARRLPARSAVGRYLEAPVLHHSIGTKVRPSMAKELEDFGVKDVLAHDDPPPFRPRMVRGLENLSHDQDWMTRFLGSGLKKSLTKAVHEGAVTDLAGTSYVPALALDPAHFGHLGGPIRDFKPPEPVTVAPGGTL